MRWCWLTPLLLLLGCGGEPLPGNPPEAVLDVPTFCDLGGPVTLDGSRSSDPDNDIILFRFTLADGSAARETTEPRLVHHCRVSGLIEAALVVTDSEGHTSRASAIISVRRP